MNDDFILEIIKKYNAGTATPSEVKLLEAYYNAFDVNENVTEKLTNDEVLRLKSEIRNRIINPAADFHPTQSMWKQYWKFMAVAAVLLLMTGWMLFFKDDKPLPTGQTLAKTETVRDADQINNLMVLPDGSSVVLSAGSTLEIVGSFHSHDKREVILKGEAFFDVAHNPEKPFIVHAGQLTTKVLGTSFNIKAIPGDESIIVTVITGKLQVASETELLTVLNPEDQLVYDVVLRDKTVTKANKDEVITWKMDDLFCDDISLENAVNIIGERYGVEIEVNDSLLKKNRFTTTFEKNESLESVLNSLVLFNDAVYTQQKEGLNTIPKYTISPK